MEFSKIKISDIGRIVTGKTPKTSIPENYGGNIPFLTPSDNLSNKYVPKTTKTITELGLSEVKNCLLPANSICVSCISSDLGKVVLTTTPLVTNQQLNSIITAIKEQKTVTIDSIKALPADTFNVNIIQPKAKPAPKPTQNPLKQPLPNKTISIVEDTINEYKHKEKVRNESGQKVIIMDSRWFVKIINDNDIFVRGFFRFQNKKNELGEWYKELIFVDSFVRHGYHRNAKIEDEENG